MILFKCEQNGQVALDFEFNWCDEPWLRIDQPLYEGVTLLLIDGVLTVSNK
ncbi:hypothetical protein [Crocosphaera chwakensis]|uniref:Uncharacterized protein n=1 Tax=Crocosphaera chwakensis CCY0110 TaxID=391612 RepID=A3IY21_9CHRO|nr:hypothetical protein [Crocosphaera chwakensis]EAZ88597.1 hypothetical protein CY0110_31370 [Crocosphaera chwakensis CCY0110]